MFDEERVVLLNYRPDGTQLNREMFTGDLSPYLEWRQISLAHSIPFSEYVTDFE
jgi:hypothetical protein